VQCDHFATADQQKCAAHYSLGCPTSSQEKEVPPHEDPQLQNNHITLQQAKSNAK
jgi:hypothetical protein